MLTTKIEVANGALAASCSLDDPQFKTTKLRTDLSLLQYAACYTMVICRSKYCLILYLSHVD